MANPNDVKKNYRLTVAPFPGTSLPKEVKKLDNGTLQIFGQHLGPNGTDDFNILSIKLINGDGDGDKNFQLATGAIDADNNVGFIFLSNGKEDGIQFVFRGGLASGNQINGGIVSAPPHSAGDDDIGTWSGQGGSGEEGEEAIEKGY